MELLDITIYQQDKIQLLSVRVWRCLVDFWCFSLQAGGNSEVVWEGHYSSESNLVPKVSNSSKINTI